VQKFDHPRPQASRTVALQFLGRSTRDRISLRRPLTYTGDTLLTNGASASLAATLLDSNGQPIAGRSLTFVLAPAYNGQACSAQTNSSGVGSCSIASVNEPAGARTVLVTFGGDNYAANSVNAPVTVTNGTSDSLEYTGTTSFTQGNDVIVTATLSDGASESAISGDTLTFALAPALTDQTCSATTDGTGTAACTIHSVSAPTGMRTLRVSFAGDGTYPANQIDTSVSVSAGLSDTLTYTGPTTIVDSNSVTVSATLVDSVTAAGISGQSVTIALAPALSNQVCTATTDSNGLATCTIDDVNSEDDGSRDLRITFAGGTGYPANQLDSTVTVTPALSDTLTYTGPITASNGSPITFTATLTDASSGLPISGAAISFVLGPAQADPATCSGTTDSSGVVSCTTGIVGMNSGPRTLVITFPGNGSYAYNEEVLVGEVTI
jgi:hypothetical protein